MILKRGGQKATKQSNSQSTSSAVYLFKAADNVERGRQRAIAVELRTRLDALCGRNEPSCRVSSSARAVFSSDSTSRRHFDDRCLQDHAHSCSSAEMAGQT